MIPISYNVRSLTQRKATTFATAGGIALVVCVFSSVLMLGNGIERTLGKSGRDDVAIVLRDGSEAELSSAIETASIGVITAHPDVLRRSNGEPDAVAEIVAVLAMETLGTEGGVSNVQIRGVGENVYDFRPSVRVIAGRKARPGADEAVVGKSIRGRFDGLDVGQRFEIRKNRFVQVVGVIEDSGSSFESEVWADLETVRTAFGRTGQVCAVRVHLRTPAAFDAFKRTMESDRQLSVDVMRESAYYEKQSEGTRVFITALGVVVAVFFSFAAMIGAMITMYSTVANRSREIGTLRALGFTKGQILFSFLLEGLMLALGGGVVGAIASLGTMFYKFSIVNFASWSEITFSFDPTPGILGGSLVFAAVMGLLGGFLPAFRASRTSVLAALRG